MTYIFCVLIGTVAGLRAVMSPAVVSWVAFAGLLDLGRTSLAFVGYRWTPWILGVAPLAELDTDQMPSTPSREVPPHFGARLVLGGLSGATIAAPKGSWPLGLVADVLGASGGTFGGSALRSAIATRFGSDRPATFAEDAIAVTAAVAIVIAAR